MLSPTQDNETGGCFICLCRAEVAIMYALVKCKTDTCRPVSTGVHMQLVLHDLSPCFFQRCCTTKIYILRTLELVTGPCGCPDGLKIAFLTSWNINADYYSGKIEYWRRAFQSCNRKSRYGNYGLLQKAIN